MSTKTKTKKKYPPVRGKMTARGSLVDVVTLAASYLGKVHSAVHAPGKSRRAKGVTTLDVTFPIESLNHLVWLWCDRKLEFVTERDQRRYGGRVLTPARSLS